MELTQLKYFYHVAELKHITRASNELHIAQPAISQSIKRLENELNVRLVEKNGRGILLTEEGKYLYERLKGIIEIFDKIPEEIKAVSERESKTVTINVLAASTACTNAIIEYKALHNDVAFKLTQDHTDQICDISIYTESYSQSSHQKENLHVFIDEMFLAVPSTPKYRRLKSVNLHDFYDKTFISLSSSKQLRSILDKYCKKIGFTPKISFESDSPLAVRNSIAGGLGVGFWTVFSWGKIDNDKILLLPIKNPPCKRNVVIKINRHQHNYNIVQDFYNYLIEKLGAER